MRSASCRTGAFVVVALSLLALELQAGDFVVNPTSGGIADRAALAEGPAGEFLAAWTQFKTIRARSYGADGLPLGLDQQINVSSFDVITIGDVSASRLAGGGYVAAWSTFEQGGISEILPSWYACFVSYRFVDANGVPGNSVGVATVQNPIIQCERGTTALAALPDGGHVIVFDQPPISGPSPMKAVRSPSQGNLPSELSTRDGRFPAAAARASGEFAAAWVGKDASDQWTAIYLRQFAADGTPAGPEVQVNDIPLTLLETRLRPAVAPAPGGAWLVVWSNFASAGDDASAASVQARFVAGDGTPLGTAFQVNTLVQGNQISARVTRLPDDSFLVAWQSEASAGADTDAFSIQARHLLADGTPDGPEYQVNSFPTGSQIAPDVASDAAGRPQFLWSRSGSEVRASDDRLDLAITVTDNTTTTVPGATLHHIVTVTNTGPLAASGAQVSVPFPAALACSWTCTASTGGACSPGPVAGDIDDAADVLPAGSVTYDATCVVASDASGTIVVTAGVVPPAGFDDTDPANDTATDTTDITGMVIDDVAVDEGNSGTTIARFTVRLLSPLANPVSVDYATGDGTATAGSDYQPASGSLSFAPGETGKNLDVTVLGDTTFEVDETFFVTLSNVSGTALLDGVAVGTILNDDSALPSGSLDELVHGSSEVRSLQSAPVAVAQYWGVAQRPLSSYEVVVDASSGDLGPQGPGLDRVASDGSILQHASGSGSARSLRWESASGTSDERVRVQSRGCIDDCDAADVFRIRMRETTGFVSRFNNSASQTTLLVLQNSGGDPIAGTVHFLDAAGALLSSQPFALSAHATVVLNTASLAPGASGSLRVTSDAAYGLLQGKAVAVEPATGFTFDTPLLARPW